MPVLEDHTFRPILSTDQVGDRDFWRDSSTKGQRPRTRPLSRQAVRRIKADPVAAEAALNRWTIQTQEG